VFHIALQRPCILTDIEVRAVSFSGITLRCLETVGLRFRFQSAPESTGKSRVRRARSRNQPVGKRDVRCCVASGGGSGLHPSCRSHPHGGLKSYEEENWVDRVWLFRARAARWLRVGAE
jgi:hypothetical protein